MNQQPDKLFREKMEGYQRPVRTSAWDKLEGALDKKSNKGLWLKIAASVVVVAVTAYLLFPNIQTKYIQNELQVIAKNKLITSEPESVKARSIDSGKVSQRFAGEDKHVDKKEERIRPEEKRMRIDDPAVRQAQSDVAQVNNEKDNLIIQDPSIEVSVESSSTSNDTTPVAVTTSTSDKARPITLVYTIEEVNDKYLDKKSLAEATTSEKKPSTLKKLLNTASDLTHDQHPLGELRQKKDEILELNFTRKNNVAKKDKPL